jgi:energy-coupling factor transporter transmembrane protein EcfT
LKESVKGMETAIWGIRVDSYRFDTSLYLTIRAAVLSLISFSYLTAIRYDRLIYSLIRNLRFPVELGYALLASFNAVGKMKDEYKRIRQAAVMRFSRKPLYYFYLIPLLVSATRYSQQAAMSMQTRGLNKKKSFIIDEKIRLYDVLIFISNLAGMLLVRLKIN